MIELPERSEETQDSQDESLDESMGTEAGDNEGLVDQIIKTDDSPKPTADELRNKLQYMPIAIKIEEAIFDFFKTILHISIFKIGTFCLAGICYMSTHFSSLTFVLLTPHFMTGINGVLLYSIFPKSLNIASRV
jgi:hypothetical protein